MAVDRAVRGSRCGRRRRRRGARSRAARCLFDRLDWFRLLADALPARRQAARRPRAQRRPPRLAVPFHPPSLRRGLCRLVFAPLRRDRQPRRRRHDVDRRRLARRRPRPCRARSDRGSRGDQVRVPQGRLDHVPQSADGQLVGRHDGEDFEAYWAKRPAQLRNTARRKAKAAASTSPSMSASTRPPGPITRRSIATAGSPTKAPSPFCVRWPSRRAKPVPCAWVSPGRTADRSRSSSGWSRMARRPSTSSLMPRMPRRCRPARSSAWRCSATSLDKDRVRRIDYGNGDEPYKADWMEEKRTLWRLSAFNPRTVNGLFGAVRAKLRRLPPAAKPLGRAAQPERAEHDGAAPDDGEEVDATLRAVLVDVLGLAGIGSRASTRAPPCSARCRNSIRWRSRDC